ncbi:MAG: B12-binding domain-containing radical SAM protein [Desulfamplus sp.]|nr:B12-binding domain-containing radical SAM protein [Desulfamplus sp.]
MGSYVRNKVALINPRKGWRPALGLLYIASYLRKAQYDVRIFEFIDEQFDRKCNDNIWKTLFSFQPDFVGFGVISWNRAVCRLQIAKIRVQLPDSIIICGGKDPSYVVDKYFSFGADIVVIGEAEETMVELLDALKSSKSFNDSPLEDIKGISYIRNGRSITNPTREPMSLKNLLFPAFDLVNYAHYTDIRLGGIPGHFIKTGYMMANRGCPYNCKFCAEKVRNIYREREIDDIISEIRWQQDRWDIDGMVFLDDLFYFNENRMRSFCDRILEEKIDLKLYAQMRVDRCPSDETLRLMRKAGFIQLAMGIESGSPRLLEHINKGITPDMCRNTVARINMAGIYTYCFLIIGLPGERVEDLEMTVELIRELKPTFVAVNYYMPMPGTKFFTEEDDEIIGTLSYSLTENQVFRSEIDQRTLSTYRNKFESLAQRNANYNLLYYPDFLWFIIKTCLFKPHCIFKGILVQIREKRYPNMFDAVKTAIINQRIIGNLSEKKKIS